ncbi:MAG: NAD-dependent epimerase/dehydratase family protein [Acidimicrobiales bacterium]|nr:NAD-dependent epimerase/dehydratase family protein [Acidimicrobiales bacterium]
MHALVTGAAGFIGSHLADALLARGHTVRGVDCFTDYYDPAIKRANLVGASTNPAFTFVEDDLADADLASLLDGIDVVFHQAAQPGVRLSWQQGFARYERDNVIVTQRLLEACRDHRLVRFVFASSSSVYGNAARYPTTETDLPRPFSPYGVTKLAAEHLCRAYAANFGVPTVSLRYFTVYGPRQRPDMAFHRLIEAGLGGPPFSLFGDGSQIRDFTYIDDVIEANLAAATAALEPGEVINISGGGSAPLYQVIELAAELLGRPITLDRRDAQPGDVRETGGAIDRAMELLGWRPQVPLREGLRRQIDWHRSRRETAS